MALKAGSGAEAAQFTLLGWLSLFSVDGLDTSKKTHMGQATAAHGGDRTVTLPFPLLPVPAASFLSI